MDRIRQALDRARLERAISESAPLRRTPDAVPSAPSPDIAGIRFETLPAAEICAAQLAELAEVPANSEASVDHVESAALQSEECSVTSEDPPATLCERDQAIYVPDERRSRLTCDAPLIVSLVLGVLITVELAHASLLLLGGGPATTQILPQVPGARAPQRHAFDVHGIVAAHLFGEAALPGTPDPAIAQPTTANLSLAGTLAMEDPKHGLAIISDDGRSKAYRVGDTVAGGELHSVFRDHVLLRRRGILETLVFPKFRVAGKSGATSSSPSGGPSAADPNAQGAPNTGDVLKGSIWSGTDGKSRGFRVFPTRNRQNFNASGLHPGDLVVAVNGASLVDQDRRSAQDIFDSINTSSQAKLTIERNGQRHDVTVDAAKSDQSDQPE